MRATNARHTAGHENKGNSHYARPTKKAHARHTSIVNTLSLNYIYYCPDNADWSWLRYMAGRDLCNQERGRNLETEKFNLRNKNKPDYNYEHQREDWRTWMVRWIEHKEKRA